MPAEMPHDTGIVDSDEQIPTELLESCAHRAGVAERVGDEGNPVDQPPHRGSDSLGDDRPMLVSCSLDGDTHETSMSQCADGNFHLLYCTA
jgi:hypothetical protein